MRRAPDGHECDRRAERNYGEIVRLTQLAARSRRRSGAGRRAEISRASSPNLTPPSTERARPKA